MKAFSKSQDDLYIFFIFASKNDYFRRYFNFNLSNLTYERQIHKRKNTVLLFFPCLPYIKFEKLK